MTGQTDIAVDLLWWIAFGLGSLLIIVAGWIPVPYFYFVGLVLPLLVLLAYAYIGLKYTISSDGHSQFADSIYYLGFIFTLVTLAVALVYLATQEQWDKVPLEELIGRFGLALSTTILGLAIRVATVNLSSTEVGLRQDAEKALIQSVEEFRGQLETSTESFRGVTESYIEELDSVTKGSIHSLKKSLSSAGESIESAIQQLARNLEASADRYDKTVTEKIEKMRLPDEIISDALTEPLARITKEVEEMPVVLARSLTSQRKLADQSEKVAARYVTLEESIEPLRKFTDSLGAVGKSMEQTVQGTRFASKVLEEAFSGSARGVNGFARELDATRKTIDSLAGTLENLEQLSSVYDKNLKVASNHRESMEIELSKSRSALQTLHSELVSAAQLISKKLG